MPSATPCKILTSLKWPSKSPHSSPLLHKFHSSPLPHSHFPQFLFISSISLIRCISYALLTSVLSSFPLFSFLLIPFLLPFFFFFFWRCLTNHFSSFSFSSFLFSFSFLFFSFLWRYLINHLPLFLFVLFPFLLFLPPLSFSFISSVFSSFFFFGYKWG